MSGLPSQMQLVQLRAVLEVPATLHDPYALCTFFLETVRVSEAAVAFPAARVCHVSECSRGTPGLHVLCRLGLLGLTFIALTADCTEPCRRLQAAPPSDNSVQLVVSRLRVCSLRAT